MRNLHHAASTLLGKARAPASLGRALPPLQVWVLEGGWTKQGSGPLPRAKTPARAVTALSRDQGPTCFCISPFSAGQLCVGSRSGCANGFLPRRRWGSCPAQGPPARAAAPHLWEGPKKTLSSEPSSIQGGQLQPHQDNPSLAALVLPRPLFHPLISSLSAPPQHR